jgi:hypothetical protein
MSLNVRLYLKLQLVPHRASAGQSHHRLLSPIRILEIGMSALLLAPVNAFCIDMKMVDTQEDLFTTPMGYARLLSHLGRQPNFGSEAVAMQDIT